MKLVLCNGQEWSIRPIIKENLDILLNDVKNSEMDLVIVVDGQEGTGKSHIGRGLGMYCATVLNSDFGPEDIKFDIEDYIKASLDAGCPKDGKFKINVLDEARNVLNRKRATSKVNVRFTNYLSECRSFQQVHILILPAFHDLDKNIVLWRMAALIHTVKNYVKDPKSPVGVSLKRGEYRLFINTAGGKKALATCYDVGQYGYPYQWEEKNVWSSKEVFTPAQIDQYKENKQKATIQKYYDEQKAQDTGTTNILQQEMSEWILGSQYSRSIGGAAKSIPAKIKAGLLKGKKINGRYYVHKSEAERLIEQAKTPIPEVEVKPFISPQEYFLRERAKTNHEE